MKAIIFILIVLSLSMNCIAQCDTLVINLKNGQVEKIAISQIQKIQFENVTSVKEQTSQSKTLDVLGNYPNPFSEQTSIEFELATAVNVEIAIYNSKGDLIQILKCDNCPSGRNTLQWDCLDKNGNKVQSGTYYYIVSYGKNIHSNKKMLIVR